MSDVNWKPKGAKVMRRDAPAEEPKKVKKVQPKDDAPAKKLKPKVGKVKRGVVEMPSSAKGDPDARARKRKQLKDKVAKTSEAKAVVEKAKKLKPKSKDEKKTKGVKEPLVVLWENEEGTARVVATVNPAQDKYPEMLNVRRQYRRKDETDWSFTRDGFSLPNPNRKMTQRIADGLSELAGMIK
jgi:hypothetical protein